MKSRTNPLRGSDRAGKAGQMVVLFALCLIAIIAMAGLLIDGGSAWANRRQAQAAADTAAIAGAVAVSNHLGAAGTAVAARTIADDNGFGPGNVDCAGAPLPNDGVTVNWPPGSGPHAGDTGFVEVYTTRAMRTAFAGAVGFPCWMVSARAVASALTQVIQCNFCALSNFGGEDRYSIDLNAGNDLRVDGDIYSGHDTWYEGAAALGGSPPRCNIGGVGADPCSPASCVAWVGLPNDRIRMCGHSLYIDNDSGCCSILSARTISVAGGWESNAHDDVLHADQLAPVCPAHPLNMGYIALGVDPETNVCIGAPPRVDPLNDPGNPADIMPKPDLAALSTCVGGLCGPELSATCKAEPGTTLKLPSFTYPSNANTLSIATGGNYTICPGIYYGGFSVSESHQPHVIMLPGTYVMIGGGFTVKQTASITSVSSQGDGVTIFNTGGQQALTESFPGNATLYTSLPCPNVQFPTSTCLDTDNTVLDRPNTFSIVAGTSITYTLTLTKAAGQPAPTGTAASFTFYNGDHPIACVGGVVVTSPANQLVAKCTTSYTTFGNKGITAVYAGDAIYKPTGAVKIQRVVPPTGAGVDGVYLGTFCTALPLPCGQILLHAPTSGRYSGLLIFQDQAQDIDQVPGVFIEPYAGAPACDETMVSTPLGMQPKFMVDGVPPNTNPVPAPCGPLGGLSGTIYSVHLYEGGTDLPSGVDIRVSGLTNLQIISGEISFTHGNPTKNARFAFDASQFANGKVRLVE